MKILVVDDSSTFRKIARKELEERGGYEVLEAKDGREALDTIRSRPVDMVTMDVEMPNLNGYDTCKHLRSDEFSSLIHRKDESVLPVIFVTANDTLKEREKGFHAGAADFITKPFLPGELLDSVNRILQPENRFKDLHALIVDDSFTTRQIVKQIIQKQGIKVYEAKNGKEAFDFLSSTSNKIDLIVTDYFMPVMDGKELCQKIRTDLNLKEIPILFLTSLSEKTIVLDLFKAGATDYLIKPFVQEELVARMEVHLSQSLLKRELTRKVLELKRMNHMKDDFLAICSHDLRTPLNSILAFSQLLRTPALTNEKKSQYLDTIESSGDFLLSLINDLLDLGKAQAETNDFELNPLDFFLILETSLKSLEPLLSAKALKLELENKIAPKLQLMGNINALTRIINNLLSNAIKFTPKGGTIKVQAHPQENEKIALVITDSGIGIPKEKIPHLFETFSKTSIAGTEGEKGTGLGLAITSQLVKKHGGSIEVTSEKEKGSSFKIVLPTISNQDDP
ncbi:MAG: hybrid sensor histidine kinase/response regulator [Nitrospinaceae bacterium]|nr:MAG: hybrid sensor histidine kinase/response regulator [Nitrospinaceae bacterium]